MNNKTIICIPNHHSNLNFLKEWAQQLSRVDVEIIIMQDTDIEVRVPDAFTNVTVYHHSDVAKDLGDDAWIIPKGTSACRSYAYYKAWQRKPKTIITLDNDCFPDSSTKDYAGMHNLILASAITLDWVGSNNQFEYTRGYPYDIRDKAPVVLNHGLWSNVPDLDAATHLINYRTFEPTKHSLIIPRYNYFPMCGMNLAWRAELTPAMYFGIFGKVYGFDQFDDIWAGVLVKKIIDHLGLAVRSGVPSVEHRKQSNVFENMKKQAPGMAMNEEFWRAVKKTKLTKGTIIDSYIELISHLPDKFEHEPQPGWTKKFKKAALIWVKLFEERQDA